MRTYKEIVKNYILIYHNYFKVILCIYSNIASVLKAVPKSVKFMLAPLKSV